MRSFIAIIPALLSSASAETIPVNTTALSNPDFKMPEG
jgi:hypothetical protein